MKTKIQTLVAWLCCLIIMVSCSQEPHDCYEDDLKNEYIKEFIKKFGLIDPNHYWTMGREVSAHVILDEAYRGQILNIYSARTGSEDAVLMSTRKAESGIFTFDYLMGVDYAYVAVVDENGHEMAGDYFKIIDNQLLVNFNKVQSRSAGAPGRALLSARNSWGIPDTDHRLAAVNPDFVDDYGYINLKNLYPVYTLSGEDCGSSAIWSNYDIYEIVGRDKPFQERGEHDGYCNLKKWFTNEYGQVQSDIEYVIGPGGSEVTIDLFYANTARHNSLGYLYYSDGASLQSKITAPRYILINDASENDIMADGMPVNSLQNVFGNPYNAYDPKPQQKYNITGHKHRLIYFDESGNPSYTFPAGTHIVFFIVIDGGDGNSNLKSPLQDPTIRYSTNELNEVMSIRSVNPGPACAGTSHKCDKIYSNFVTYYWGHNLIMGVEDENDDDMNDMLFSINGTFVNNDDIPVINRPKIDDVQWIIAAEDLGGSDDFDFNDVVFGVGYNAITRKIIVTPLAAGGTLPVYIMYDSVPLGCELHAWFGVNTSTMHNTFTFTGAGKPFEIDYTGDGDFSLSKALITNGQMGGFSLMVEGSRGTNIITPPGQGEAPQMICLGPNWRWPKERCRIDEAYQGFGLWGSSYLNTTWTSDYNASLVVKWK